jgi:microcystin-dependent protein
MSQPYVGEIRMFAGNFAPAGWSFCDGSIMAISQNEVLFALIGTTYGGDGQTTFALPDLRGRAPIHQAAGKPLGSAGGSEAVTLTGNQLASHNHSLVATSAAASAAAGPTGMLAASSTTPFYGTAPATTAMAADALTASGGGQPHDNMAPFTAVGFIIALFGIFPTSG